MKYHPTLNVMMVLVITGQAFAGEQAPASTRMSVKTPLLEARHAVDAGDYPSAIEHYDSALKHAPDSADLLIETGRVAGWADRNLLAARYYQRALALAPERRDDIVPALTQQLAWAGLGELALEFPPPPALERAILREHEPQVTAAWDRISDSDHAHQRFYRVALDMPARARERLGIHLRQGTIRDESRASLPDQTLQEAHARYQGQWGRAESDWGHVTPAFLIGQRIFDEWQQTYWKADIRWMPIDRLWLDAESGNTFIDTPRAIQNEVEVNVHSLSQRMRFNSLWQGGLSESLLRFDDGNRRQRFAGWIERRMRQRPDLVIGVNALRFDDSEPDKGLGYYSPERYVEARVYADISAEFGMHVPGIRVGQGWLRETPGDRSWLSTLEARWDWHASEDHRFSMRSGWSDSRAGSAGGGDGYSRRYLSVDWNWRP